MTILIYLSLCSCWWIGQVYNVLQFGQDEAINLNKKIHKFQYFIISKILFLSWPALGLSCNPNHVVKKNRRTMQILLSYSIIIPLFTEHHVHCMLYIVHLWFYKFIEKADYLKHVKLFELLVEYLMIYSKHKRGHPDPL